MASAAIGRFAMTGPTSEPRRLRVACRVDASPRAGGGHVMRCLTLADRLTDTGADVTFVASEITDALARMIAERGIRLQRIEARSSREGVDWDVECWSAEAQMQDAAATVAALRAMQDWLVVDHYGLDARWEAAARGIARRIAVIDDLANRPHDCDLLLDQTHGRAVDDYRPLVGEKPVLLTGAKYALLRPEFAAVRRDAIARRRSGDGVARILVSLGMTDVGGLTDAAVRAALTRTAAAIDVVIGSAAPTLAALHRLADDEPRVTLHVDTPQIAALMAAADVSIGAAGSTSWERCCLALPAVTVVLAANQRLIGERLAAAGAIRLVACEAGAIGDAVADLTEHPAARSAMAEAAAMLCDGAGAARVAAAMLDSGRDQWTV